MNKRFFINILALLFSFSAFAVKPNIQQNKMKRAPIAKNNKQEIKPTRKTNGNNFNKQTEMPTFGESWSKVIRLKWTSLSQDDAWNIGASMVTCGVIAYLYSHMPKNSMPNNAVIVSHDDQDADNANKNIHIPKPQAVHNPVPILLNNEDRECDVCLDDKKGHEFCTLSCCGHNASCLDCLAEMMDGPLKEKTTTEIKCPNRDCLQPINEQDLRKITHAHPEIYKNYHDIAAQEWLDKNTKHCPTPDCPYAFVNDEGNQESFTCPQCQHNYCSDCLKPHAMNMTCAQAEEDLKLTGNRTRAAQADEEWKAQNSKKCPQCRADIEKNEGCNHMTCKCRHEFCWVCLSRWKICGCPMFPPVQNNLLNNAINGNRQQGQQNMNNQPHRDLGDLLNIWLNLPPVNQPNIINPVRNVPNNNANANANRPNNNVNVNNNNRQGVNANNVNRSANANANRPNNANANNVNRPANANANRPNNNANRAAAQRGARK